ncbi:carboxylesterase/lipase family protein [Microterricola pindariensis]|uniref:Carboxylic ester hydrolase n=1 Tax=Microterricola pindariensis TaxID=478010 RepID=A0ABX5ATD5_9MICO|nr:carboxylesterase family protein [Microterricola pindariensis]PPL16422.1 carboxylesterase [Microterricola pindariensis]
MTEQTEFDITVAPEVQTAAGVVRGIWRSPRGWRGLASAAFHGIPFAEAPVGPLRFAAPVPHAAWEGVRDALEMGPTPQRKTLSEITLIPEPSIEGESTLNVNVFTPAPAAAASAGLPVLVYIHGGGYTAGSPASPWYDGAAFNRDGVVTVSISYRLGFDGFGCIDGAPDNRGVLDWLLALEWVQQNIAAFGGDPARVTIVGQSAGGGAVLTLLGMEAAQHLFSGVYCISGAVGDVARPRAQQLARRLAELAGVPATREGFASLSEERILELQQKAQEPADGPGNPLDMLGRMIADGLALAPMIDEKLILRPTLDSFRIGVGADKPLVLGATDDEFSMAMDEAKGKLRFIPKSFMLGKAGLGKVKRKAYFAANPDVAKRDTAGAVGRYMTDAMFRTAVLKVTEAREAGAAGGTSTAGAPTWVYRFSWPSPVFTYAMHCLDVPFFFDCLDSVRIDALAGANPPQALADELHAEAVAFVSTGVAPWPKYTENARATRVFDLPSAVIADGYGGVRPLLAPVPA